MICGCGNLIEKVRLELGLKVCKSCAFSGIAQSKPMGRMVYGHKTGAEIEILSEESWKENYKRFTPNGARSAVKNFSKHICK